MYWSEYHDNGSYFYTGKFEEDGTFTGFYNHQSAVAGLTKNLDSKTVGNTGTVKINAKCMK